MFLIAQNVLLLKTELPWMDRNLNNTTNQTEQQQTKQQTVFLAEENEHKVKHKKKQTL